MAKENLRRNGCRRRYLAEELQEEILVRLPAKSIVRFESVCKTWLCLFHSRPFIDTYGRRRRRDPHEYSLYTISKEDVVKMVPGLAGVGALTIMFGPSSNGIYCLTSYLRSRSPRDRILSSKIALINPTTHDCRIAEPFPCEFLGLISNISSHRELHFGFGSVQRISGNPEDHRVVVLLQHGHSCFLDVFVYNVTRGEWRKIVGTGPGKRDILNIPGRRITDLIHPMQVCPQKLFKGCFHWLAALEGNLKSVLSFDFADESFKLMGAGGPRSFVSHGNRVLWSGDVLVLHDHLAVLHLYELHHCYGLRQCVEVDVWMMMEYGVEESWSKVYTINPCDLYLDICRLYGITCSYSPNDGIIIHQLFFEDVREKRIKCFDKNVVRDIESLGDFEKEFCLNTLGISTYIETLERL